MSVQEKPVKSKKAYDFRSLRDEKKSTQSISSLSIGQLRRNGQRLEQELSLADHKIRFYQERRDLYIGQTDEFSREEAQDAQEELQLWLENRRQVKTQLKSVNEQLRAVCGPQQKPRKTKNYVLKKVKGPPSDNE